LGARHPRITTALHLLDWGAWGKSLIVRGPLVRWSNLVTRKSQIAIEYAYRLRSRSSQTWVFWVHASNSTRFKQAYSDIASRVELPGRDDPNADILRLVFNWLRDEGNGHWLMILDNADDADVFFPRGSSGIREASAFSGSETSLASFLPQSSNGTVLITSRNLGVAARLLDSVDIIVKVEPMEKTEALALVRTRLAISGSMEPDAATLVKALDGIPLAITQACAYIRTYATRFTVSSYLELFLESEMNQARLLQNADIGDVRRDPSVPDAVLTTWQISFEQIRESTPAAAELLSFMCVLDRQGIPEFLLHDSTNRLDFEDRLRPLIDFSLVSTQLDDHTFEMHRLVQLATKRWLASHSELAGWERKALQKMARVYPFGEHKNWGICGELLPHSKAILAYMVESKGDIRNQASLLHNTAGYLYTRGEYAAAEEMHRRALEGKEKVLGKEHPNTLASMNNLAEVLRDQGKYEQAEKMNRRTLKRKEKVLGKEHPDTLASMNNLALVLDSQGKYDKAEEMYRRTLEGKEKVLGKEHPLTLTSMNNVAQVLDSQGKYDEAEEMHRRTLKRREKVLGKEHPLTLASMNNLAAVLNSQKKYDEAEKIQRRTLEKQEKILGEEHPITLTSVYCLAYLYHQRKRYETASELYQRVCDASKRILGPQHPTTVGCCNTFSRMVSEMDQSTR
jgi:tetratricopeptide (TPR) repeat protein